jgi:hypothetical protein
MRPSPPTAVAARVLIERHSAHAGPPDLKRLRRLLDEDVSLERAWHELNEARKRLAPQVTVEALMFCCAPAVPRWSAKTCTSGSLR